MHLLFKVVMEAPLKKITVILKKIDKLANSLYGGHDTDTSLNGKLLLKTIQYIIFIYIYDIDPDNIRDLAEDTEQEFVAYAHYMHLRTQYERFNKEYEKHVKEIKKRAYTDILAQTNNDKSHPMISIFNYIVLHKEMHIRRPKQSPIKKITQGTVANFSERCNNSVTTELCEFDGKNVYCSLIFAKLPSDENDDIKDPVECDFDFHYKDDKYKFIYPKTEIFSVIVTKKWGTMFRLLHNIFHLHGYINMSILQIINKDKVDDEDKNVEELSKRPWPEGLA